jgi:hypothetical protein
MNLFYLSADPVEAAQQHCDKHVVKMPLESAQMLSTTHRLLEASPLKVELQHPVTGRWLKRVMYLYPEEQVVLQPRPTKANPDHYGMVITNPRCYAVAHANHPTTVWTRLNAATYQWHVTLAKALLAEYTHRYGRVAKAQALVDGLLSRTPVGLPSGELVPPPLAMPDQYKDPADAVTSYRRFYAVEKARFARWTGRPAPQWFVDAVRANT